MRFDLSDEEWALLEPLFPRNRKSARVDDRRILNAIFYVLRTGRRRIATRYDKLARNFLAATTLVGILYWIKL